MSYRLRRVYQPRWKVSISASVDLLFQFRLFLFPLSCPYRVLLYTRLPCVVSGTLRAFDGGLLNMETFSHRCCPLDGSCCQGDGKSDFRGLSHFWSGSDRLRYE